MITPHFSEIITAIVYLVLLISIGIAFRSFSSNINDYLKAGCRGTWWLVGGSTFMASFTAMTFVAIAGQSFVAGWSVALITFAAVGIFLLHALYFAPRYRQMRVTSQGDVLFQRFGRGAEQFVSYYGILSGALNAALALLGTATFISAVFGIPLWLLIIVTGAVITIYSTCSGSWGVLATDFVQASILIPITLAVSVLCLCEVGGITNLFGMIREQGLTQDFALIKETGHVYKTPVKLAAGLFTWPWLVGLVFYQVVNATCLSAKYITVKDGKEARKAALFVAVMMAFGSLIWYIPPIVARLIYYQDVMALQGVRGIKNAADAAYAVASAKVLPVGLIGLMAMAILAATMSSLDSAFNSISALVVRNIYPQLARWTGLPQITDPGRQLRFGRTINFVYGGILITLGLAFASASGGDGLYSYMLLVMALIGFPATVPLFMGMFVRKAPDWAYFSSLATGLLGGIFCTLATRYDFGFTMTWHLQLAIIGPCGMIGYLAALPFWKRTASEYKERVTRFYTQMDTPVDFTREIGEGNDVRQFRMVGLFVMIAGALVLLLLLVPNGLRGRLVIGCIAAFPLGVGITLWRKGRAPKPHAEQRAQSPR